MSKVYVGNLPYSITEEKLEELFQTFGSVNSCKIITDFETGRSKGFGFVEMASQEEADTAINQLDNTNYEGRTIKVNVARERKGGRYNNNDDRFYSRRG
jgi:RNA recognition motif-containing protein